MNLSQVKEKIYEVTEMFFARATIAWAEQTMTKPPVPYVTLRTGAVNKSTFPCTDDNGDRYYTCDTILEVNLYTKGKAASNMKGATNNFENTASDDFMEFVKFLESEEIVDLLALWNFSMELNPPVRDLSEFLNDSKFRYRAMAEFTVSYAEVATGRYGLSNMPFVPNSSGGGKEEYTEAEDYYIDEVEITEVKEETNE